MKLSWETYTKLRLKVYHELKQWSLQSETEDVLHWILIKRLEGKGRKQLVKYSVIDILRSHYGVKKKYPSRKRIRLTLNHSVWWRGRDGKLKKTVNELFNKV